MSSKAARAFVHDKENRRIESENLEKFYVERDEFHERNSSSAVQEFPIQNIQHYTEAPSNTSVATPPINAFEIKKQIEDHCIRCNMINDKDLHFINFDIQKNAKYLHDHCDTISWVTNPEKAILEFDTFDENLYFVVPTRSKTVSYSAIAFFESVLMEEVMQIRSKLIQKREFCCPKCARFNIVDPLVELKLSTISKFLMSSHCYRSCKEEIKILRSLSTSIVSLQRIRKWQLNK